MSETLLNLIVTVISGVLVFTLGQLFVEFILRPIQEYKKLKADVAKELVYQAMYYQNPQDITQYKNWPKWQEGSEKIRVLASEVAAFAEIKPVQIFVFYSIPSKKKLTEAARYLIGLSNAFLLRPDMKEFENRYAADFVPKIKRLLRISKTVY